MPKSPGGALLQGFSIERNSPVPIYRQLDASLRRLILDGTLVSGQKLPSTRELALELGVSRITVKSVYEQLTAEGYALAKTGAGTFVANGLDLEASSKNRRPRSKGKSPEIEVSERARTIMSSKASMRHGKIDPFRPGVPALDLFPVKVWNKYLLDAATNDARRNLSYGEVNGSAALRASIARHLTDARGMQVDPAQIVITSGAQLAFVLIAFVLLNKGDTVWYENPGHIAGRDVMQIMGANVAPVPIDDEGMDLNFAIENHPRPTLIFTTPSHQQPLGTTMSFARRLALLNYAQENGAWIIEDDYDSEFRYRGRRDVLFDCLTKDCSDSLEPQPTDAGMHMLAWLKNGVDDQAAHLALLEVGIESLPLSVYCIKPLGRSGIVLGFSGVDERRIPKLTMRMSETLRSLTSFKYRGSIR